MPYGLIALLVSIGLAIRYLLGDEASRSAKWGVILTVTASLVIWWLYPQWTAAATVLQVIVSIAILVHLRVSSCGL